MPGRKRKYLLEEGYRNRRMNFRFDPDTVEKMDYIRADMLSKRLQAGDNYTTMIETIVDIFYNRIKKEEIEKEKNSGGGIINQ